MSSFTFVPQNISFRDTGDSEDTAATGQSLVIPSKRQKVQLACNACRRSKSRCDGRRPSCSRCAGRASGSKCVYEKEAMKAQNYIALLENKVLELESRTSMPSSHNDEQIRSASQVRTLGCENLQDTTQSNEKLRHASSATGHLLNRTDALVMVPTVQPKSFDGAGSSIAAFLHSTSHSIGIEEVMNKVTSLTEHNGDGSIHKSFMRSNAPRQLQPPPRRLADTLISKFWTYIHSIFPVLEKGSIESTYSKLWSSEPHNSFESSSDDFATDMAIFNIIFALVCQMENEEESADYFYQTSRQYYAIDAIDEPSVKTVQLLVLTGIYLQSTKFASRSWTVVGLATRYAQYLGFDVKKDELPARVEHGYVIQRRIWHCCIMLDRLLSLSFNRLSMIAREIEIDLPESSTESGHISAVIRYSAILFEIMNNTLVEIYHRPLRGDGLENSVPCWWERSKLANVLKQNRALDDLSMRIPDYLNPDPTNRQMDLVYSEEIAWQSYVFRSRFLYVRILILRPLLLSAAVATFRQDSRGLNSKSSLLSIDEKTARSCCYLCIDTVHELVTHMSSRLTTARSTGKWREFHYTFVCAISVSIARLCSFNDEGFCKYQLNKSWDLCVKTLHHYKPRIESAQRAMNILDSLNSEVTKITQDGPGANLQASRVEYPNDEQHASFPGAASPMNWNDPIISFDPFGLDYAWLNSEVGGLGWLGV